MQKTNDAQKYYNKGLTLICIAILIFIIIITGGIQTIKIYAILSSIGDNDFTSILISILISFISISGIIFLLSVFTLISVAKGILEAKRENFIQNIKIKNNNPYIYYRELPNNYGIGIATLLMDSTIENEKDIVAVILDLCAKGYLKLIKVNDEKYNVEILNDIDEKLLLNEKYIMQCIKEDTIKNLDYNKWLDFCIQDGEREELFNRKKQNNISNKNSLLSGDSGFKKLILMCIIADITIGLILGLINIKNMDIINVISTIIIMIIGFFVLYILLGIVLIVIPKIVLSLKRTNKTAYETQRMKYLELTKKGEAELEKMYAFKAFIKDFGMFASKNPEEIVLWEFYLSYAQVFGLTNEILKTGYKKIIKNGSFIIDDFDSIKLIKLNVAM